MPHLESILLWLVQVIDFLLETFFISSLPRPPKTFHHDRQGTKNTRSSTGGDNHNHNSSNTNNASKTATTLLQSACTCFEIKQEELTRDMIKKKYKKLSLIHHPDRNENSSESVAKMQEINQAYEILQEEIDRREGRISDSNGDDSNDDDGDEVDRPYHHQYNEAEQQEDKEYRHTTSSQKNKKKNTHKTTKRERRRTKQRESYRQRKAREDAERNRREEIRRQRRKMEEDMKREWKEQQKLRDQRKQKKRQFVQKNKSRYYGTELDTLSGRDKAHLQWKSAILGQQQQQQQRQAQNNNNNETRHQDSMQQQQQQQATTTSLHDIDEDRGHPSGAHSNESSSSTTRASAPAGRTTRNTKPKYSVMECCNHEIVVAMRLGWEEQALEYVQSGINQIVIRRVEQEWLKELHRSGGKNIGMRTRIKIDDDLRDKVMNYLTQGVDDDGNNLLHYAIYLEHDVMLSYIIHIANQYERLAEVIIVPNLRGDTVYDFSFGCSYQNPTLATRVQNLWTNAKDELEGRKLLPSVKRLWKNRFYNTNNNKYPNLDPFLNTVVSFLIGTTVCECGWLASAVITFLTKPNLTPEEEEELGAFARGDESTYSMIMNPAQFFADHTVWCILRPMLQFVWNEGFPSFLPFFRDHWMYKVIWGVVLFVTNLYLLDYMSHVGILLLRLGTFIENIFNWFLDLIPISNKLMERYEYSTSCKRMVHLLTLVCVFWGCKTRILPFLFQGFLDENGNLTLPPPPSEEEVFDSGGTIADAIAKFNAFEESWQLENN